MLQASLNIHTEDVETEQWECQAYEEKTENKKEWNIGLLFAFPHYDLLPFPCSHYYGCKTRGDRGQFHHFFSLLFIIGLVLGRAFCGWVCPGAGIQEICSSIRDKPVRKGNWIKYLIWVPWMSVIVIFAIRSGGLSKVDPFFQIHKGISITQPTDYIVFYSFLPS